MKKTKTTFRLLLVCASCSTLFFSGCASSVQAASSAPSIAEAVSSSSHEASQPQTEEELPRENLHYRQAELQTYQKLGAQIFLGEEAYPLAESIYNYRDYHNMFIFTENFTDITQLEPELLVEIAASQAPHVDLYSPEFRASSGNIRKFFLDQREKGTPIRMISYGSDARQKAKYLFGTDYDLPRQDGATFRYSPDLDIYYLYAEGSSMSSDYPILLEVRQDDDLYTAKSILMSYWSFSGTWSNPDGSWESDEYCSMDAVKEYLSTKPKDALPILTFTLQKSGDIYRVVGFQRETAA